MKVLILGQTGRIGYKLQAMLGYAEGISVEGTSREDVDFMSPDKVSSVIERKRPDVIVNAVGYTDLDKAETDQETCYKVNAETPTEIALRCSHRSIKLIHISTAHVFSGEKEKPYTEFDKVNPKSFYAKTKFLAEENIVKINPHALILRVGDIYDNRSGFLPKIFQACRMQTELKAFTNRIIGPTSSYYVANQIRYLASSDMLKTMRGIYHIAPYGECTSYEFFQTAVNRICYRYGFDKIEVQEQEADGSEYLAYRPPYSVMDCSFYASRTDIHIPSWKRELGDFIHTYNLEKP